MQKLYLIFLLLLPTAEYAAYEGWVTKDGRSVPDADNMKSVKGFGGWLIVTPDKDWLEKWNIY